MIPLNRWEREFIAGRFDNWRRTFATPPTPPYNEEYASDRLMELDRLIYYIKCLSLGIPIDETTY